MRVKLEAAMGVELYYASEGECAFEFFCLCSLRVLSRKLYP